MNQEQDNKTHNSSFENNEKTNESNTPKSTAVNTEQKKSSENQNVNSNTSNSSNKTDTTASSVESVKETAKETYDQAKGIVGQAYGVATKRAAEAIDDQKAALTGGLTSVADTIKQVGDNLNSNVEPNVITETAAKYTNSLATQIEGISDYFDRKDIGEIVSDVETFARKYPAYFVGGALALGFLAARFLKSSAPKKLTKAAGQSFGGKSVNPS